MEDTGDAQRAGKERNIEKHAISEEPMSMEEPISKEEVDGNSSLHGVEAMFADDSDEVQFVMDSLATDTVVPDSQFVFDSEDVTRQEKIDGDLFNEIDERSRKCLNATPCNQGEYISI
jgi:hypothetical protein